MTGRRIALATVHAAVDAHAPDLRDAAIVAIGEGQDNAAFAVGDALIVRFAKARGPARRAARIEREVRVLSIVAPIAPLAVPQPRFVIPEEGALAYATLPGEPLAAHRDAAHPYAIAIAATLGRFLRALHDVPPATVADIVPTDDDTPKQWRNDAARICRRLGTAIPVTCRAAVDVFLHTDPPPRHEGEPVFSHNDLGIEHVLVDPATFAVTGIIDWSDAALCDPAYDFGLIDRDLGRAALIAALAAYGATAPDAQTLFTRAIFYARCSALEDLIDALEASDPMRIDGANAALTRAFAP
ncbi:MAG: phosphotransferase [Candidatus Eremiobacteraeota bacterium]|nr:phosphotransferase [Candidatus Eremiobacteraeota bacterium]